MGIYAGSIVENLTFQGCENKTLCPSTHTLLERNLTLTDFSCGFGYSSLNECFFCPKSVLLNDRRTEEFYISYITPLPGLKVRTDLEVLTVPLAN